MSDFVIPDPPAFDPRETYALDGHGGVRRGSDGAAIPDDAANADWRAFLAWRAAGNEAAPAPISAPTVVDWLQFMGLFSRAEQIAIAVSSDPDVALFRMMATGLGGDLVLADPRVAQGLDALVAAGCIGAPRKAQILTGAAPPA